MNKSHDRIKYSMRQLSWLSIEDQWDEKGAWHFLSICETNRFDSSWIDSLLFNYCNKFYKHCTGAFGGSGLLLVSLASAFHLHLHCCIPGRLWTIDHCLPCSVLPALAAFHFLSNSACSSPKPTCRHFQWGLSTMGECTCRRREERRGSSDNCTFNKLLLE